jgi:hypothetical protein
MIIVKYISIKISMMSYAHNPNGAAFADPTWGHLPQTPVVIHVHAVHHSVVQAFLMS